VRRPPPRATIGAVSSREGAPIPASCTLVLIPGLYDSGPTHWQSVWEALDPHCSRLAQADWATPRCDDWVATLDAAVAAVGPGAVLVAHSLGCATVAHWSRRSALPARCALLVAPADVDAPTFPPGTTGFQPMPLDPLRLPSLVVASEDDPFVTLDRAHHFASAWGSRFVPLGAAGHLNAATGLGEWPEGQRLLRELVASSGE
jgi:predicted alpha/beta hydrolase family esterase